MSDEQSTVRPDVLTPTAGERRNHQRSTDQRWRTRLTLIEPNTIVVRGYPVDELMGRLSFGEGIYLLLIGELPTPSIGRLIEAILVSSLDHGVTPPSTLSARHTASTGAPLRACVAAGILGFGRHFGGDIESCVKFLDEGLQLVRSGRSFDDAATEIVGRCLEQDRTPPGFGHRYHERDPRAARLFQMALELEVEGGHVWMIRAAERALAAAGAKAVPINVDGAIAAVCGDIGLSTAVANALFVIARVPGLVAHALEEMEHEAPLRTIDAKDHVYVGPTRRRLPETRR